MAILHKFQNHDWKNGFWTENSILKTNHYQPEVLIIGTFNPNSQNENFADFFYGRNYFWTALKNVFISKCTVLPNRRMPTNGQPVFPLNPTIEEVFNICKIAKLGFADLINGVLINADNYIALPNDNIIFNNKEYNLILDNASKGILGLRELDIINQVEWNVKNITSYLYDNPKIKFVIFTRKPNGIWLNKWNEIVNSVYSKNINFEILYTPSGRRLTKPVMSSLIQRWINNSNWLQEKECNPDNF